MFVATFYSFKGGVGRSLAVANVAYELFRRGRRVLIVDFDLEAPGLDTFEVFRPSGPTPGVVEFVSAFMETSVAPSIKDHVYEAPVSVDAQGSVEAEGSGKIWVMPAGARDGSYATRFRRIDWERLYAERDGYLLLEDMKAQWQEDLAPDYVLIDSRTGHTDIGGICTRQLPDAVVLMFFPNEQNLRGLERVAESIRAESLPPRQKNIQQLFVMSNVPDLDDEDQILLRTESAFRERLQFAQLTATIHRYDSMALLTQAVFTQQRPRSRLAHEYRMLTQEIVRRNYGDPEGALEAIHALRRGPGTQLEAMQSIRTEGELERLRRMHSKDERVLLEVGRLYLDSGRVPSAAEVLDDAVALAPEVPEIRMLRARTRSILQDGAGAAEDAKAIFASSEADDHELLTALWILRDVAPQSLPEVMDRLRIDKLASGPRRALAKALDQSESELRLSVRLLESIPLIDRGEELLDLRSDIRGDLALRYIGLGQFRAAVKVLQEEIHETPDPGIAVQFNLAFALWAATGVAPEADFAAVARSHEAGEAPPPDPNYSQCLALTYAIVGKREVARELVQRAGDLLQESESRFVFSCWRYQSIRPREFRDDLEELSTFVERGAPWPRLLREHGVKSPHA